jgi:ribosomal protein S19E (S16A)
MNSYSPESKQYQVKSQVSEAELRLKKKVIKKIITSLARRGFVPFGFAGGRVITERGKAIGDDLSQIFLSFVSLSVFLNDPRHVS